MTKSVEPETLGARGRYSSDMAKNAHINARCTDDDKEGYEALAKQLGYGGISDLIIGTLDALKNTVDSDGWQCRLLHLSGAEVTAIGERPDSPSADTAFPVVAPERFWNAVHRELQEQVLAK